eukprot:UC4_evm1s1393
MWDELSISSASSKDSISASFPTMDAEIEDLGRDLVLIDLENIFASIAHADLSRASKLLQNILPTATLDNEVDNVGHHHRRADIVPFLHAIDAIIGYEARYLAMDHVKRAPSRAGKGKREDLISGYSGALLSRLRNCLTHSSTQTLNQLILATCSVCTARLLAQDVHREVFSRAMPSNVACLRQAKIIDDITSQYLCQSMPTCILDWYKAVQTEMHTLRVLLLGHAALSSYSLRDCLVNLGEAKDLISQWSKFFEASRQERMHSVSWKTMDQLRRLLISKGTIQFHETLRRPIPSTADIRSLDLSTPSSTKAKLSPPLWTTVSLQDFGHEYFTARVKAFHLSAPENTRISILRHEEIFRAYSGINMESGGNNFHLKGYSHPETDFSSLSGLQKTPLIFTFPDFPTDELGVQKAQGHHVDLFSLATHYSHVLGRDMEADAYSRAIERPIVKYNEAKLDYKGNRSALERGYLGNAYYMVRAEPWCTLAIVVSQHKKTGLVNKKDEDGITLFLRSMGAALAEGIFIIAG